VDLDSAPAMIGPLGEAAGSAAMAQNQSARFYGSPIVVEFSFLVEVGEVISREVVAVHSVVGNSSVAIDLQTSSTCLSLTLVVIGNVIGILFKEKKLETR
jgi:hypothetical protein